MTIIREESFLVPLKAETWKRTQGVAGGKRHNNPRYIRWKADFARWCYMHRVYPTPWEQAVLLDVTVYFKAPKRPKKNYPSRGDWDNYGKAVSDALQGICYKDDRQIVEGTVRKVYSEHDCLKVLVRCVNW